MQSQSTHVPAEFVLIDSSCVRLVTLQVQSVYNGCVLVYARIDYVTRTDYVSDV